MREKECLLSVIIPVFKVEKYICRCLESLLKQNSDGVEIILVDDGSPDKCPEICDKYATENPIIKVIHKENGGAASARNAGLESAIGEWISFVDPDDTVSLDYFSTIAKLINNKVDMIIFSFELENITVQSSTTYYYKIDDFCGNAAFALEKIEQKGVFNYIWNKIYKKTIIEQTCGIRFKVGSEPGEDLLFNCDYYNRVKNVILSKKCLYKYYKQDSIENSLAHKYYTDLNEKTKMFIKARCDLYGRIGLDSEQNEQELAKQNVYYLFKCIPNMYRQGKIFKRNERLEFYTQIIENKEIRKWIQNDKTREYLICMFRILYKIKSPILLDTTYRVLFILKNFRDCLGRN